MKKQTITELAATFLLVMFLYTAFSKYFGWVNFQQAMENQHLSTVLTTLLIWILPPVEIATGILLLFPGTRLIGFLIASSLMLLFTGYAGLVLAGYFPNEPCPCGGILKEMTWPQHLAFNSSFFGVAFAGTLVEWTLYKNKQVHRSPQNISRAKSG